MGSPRARSAGLSSTPYQSRHAGLPSPPWTVCINVFVHLVIFLKTRIRTLDVSNTKNSMETRMVEILLLFILVGCAQTAAVGDPMEVVSLLFFCAPKFVRLLIQV